MKRHDRVKPQPPTSEHIARLLEEESHQVKASPFALLSGVSKPVTELLWSAFDGYSLALVAFFDYLLLDLKTEGAQNRFLVLSTVQFRFLEIFLEHCRENLLEAPLGSNNVADASMTMPVRFESYEEEPQPVGAAKEVITRRQTARRTSFHSSHRLRVRYIDKKGKISDRDYETCAAIKTVCHTLCDKRLKGSASRLVELPNLILRALWASAKMFDSVKNPDGGNARQAFIEQLLTPAARKDPWIAFQFKCPFIYETAMLDMEVHHKGAMIESSKRLKAMVEKREEEHRRQSNAEPTQPKKSIDVERLTLAIYLYYRMVIDKLDVSIGQCETAFCLVMYLFEEIVNSHREARSGLLLANPESVQMAQRDIQRSPVLFEKVLHVVEESVRMVSSLSVANSSAAAALQAESASATIIAAIYESASKLKLGLGRIKFVESIQEEDTQALKRRFFWQRNLQISWKLLEKELLRHYSPVRANQVAAFARQYPDCCAFMVDPKVNSEAFLRSIRHLNRLYPLFRFFEVSFTNDGNVTNTAETKEEESIRTRYSPKNEKLFSDDIVRDADAVEEQFNRESEAKRRGLRGGSRFCVINDGPSKRCFIMFDSPRSHQRFCNFSVMEALTTVRQEKHLPMYPFMLRQYAGVFGNYKWCPTDLSRLAASQKIYARVLESDFGPSSLKAPEDGASNAHLRPNFDPDNIDDVDINDDHENLWLFVKTLFFQVYQFCATGVESCRRLGDSLFMDVLMGHERDFKTYRLTHRICATLDEYMADYPFFTLPGNDINRPASATKAATDKSNRAPHVIDDISLAAARSKGIAHTAEVVLCFLCLGAVHVLKGDTVFRLRTYLHSLEPHLAERHLALRHYLDLLDSYNSNKNIIVEGETLRTVQLVFKRDLAYENNLHLKAPGKFDDLIFPSAYGLSESGRRELARINSMIYRFVVDKLLSIDMRGQVLFDLDHQKTLRTKRARDRPLSVSTNDSASTADDRDSSQSSCSNGSRTRNNSLSWRPFSGANSSRKRAMTDSGAFGEDVSDEAASDDSRAARHLKKVTHTAARNAARMTQIEMLNQKPMSGLKTASVPLRSTLRGAVGGNDDDDDDDDKEGESISRASTLQEEATVYDVYRGLAGIRKSAPLKQLCANYQDALCHDLVYDLPKSVVYRGLESAVQALERKVSKAREGAATRKESDRQRSSSSGSSSNDQILEALEREHRYIVALVSKTAPPSIINGAYCARGMQGKLEDSQQMREAYAAVMQSAALFAPIEPQTREPFTRSNLCQRAPIAYAQGDCESMGAVLSGLTHLGKWRYEVCSEFRISAVIANDGAEPEYQSASLQPLCEFMRSIEWMLYHRCSSVEAIEQRKRVQDDVLNSERFWNIDADRFVWYQLNSRLPVDYNPLSYEEVLGHMLDDYELKDRLRSEQTKNHLFEHQEDEDDQDPGDEEEREFIEGILSGEGDATELAAKEQLITGGELADVADHFWTLKAPLSFVDNGGWTLRLDSGQKEREASVERGGVPPVSEGLSLIVGEYSQTISNLVKNATSLDKQRSVSRSPAVRFIREKLDLETQRNHPPKPAAAAAAVASSHVDKRARTMPPPAPIAPRQRSPPRQSITSLSVGDFDIRLDDHGSNIPLAPTSDKPPMLWPEQLYSGERAEKSAVGKGQRVGRV